MRRILRTSTCIMRVLLAPAGQTSSQTYFVKVTPTFQAAAHIIIHVCCRRAASSAQLSPRCCCQR
jgi:hypothetical protein